MKKMLILSEAYGLGHTKVAEAIREGVQTLDRQWNVRVLELASLLRPLTAQLLTKVYLHSLRKYPRLWGHFYRKHETQRLHPSFDYCLYYLLYSRFRTFMSDFRPDVVLCTHPFPLAALARLKARNELRCMLGAVVTDYCAHGSWVSEKVDQYFIPSAHLTTPFRQLGVRRDQITVLNGLPIRPSFWTSMDKSEARRHFGLKHMPTVLCMGGGLGLGLSEAFLRSLALLLDQMQIVIVTGHNRLLYERLSREPIALHPHFHLFSYVEDIHALMDATDLLVTKPGAVTCTEARAKKIKMILMNPIPGQEEENCKYFTLLGQAVRVENTHQVELLIQSMMADESSRADVHPLHFAAQDTYDGQQVIETILRSVSPPQAFHLSS